MLACNNDNRVSGMHLVLRCKSGRTYKVVLRHSNTWTGTVPLRLGSRVFAMISDRWRNSPGSVLAGVVQTGGAVKNCLTTLGE